MRTAWGLTRYSVCSPAGLTETLGAAVGRILIVGCEPETVGDGIGLSEPVAAAVPAAVTTVLDLLTEIATTPESRAG
jgi:hydrogenase maturation protease